ncbi:MAG: hypothetical protein HY443_00765 [Candidatus Nealsonbacteria bacterium]|nr:hypothetical protein [Candidatus Nealsonbacteria bacterium]
MEGKTKMTYQEAKKIMAENLIGPEEIREISGKLGVPDPFQFRKEIPEIPFKEDFLKKNSRDYLLVLGLPEAADGEALTLNKLRSIFGVDPRQSEPCFYNQDWYLKEEFAKDKVLGFEWYLIARRVRDDSRGKSPEDLLVENSESFPSALLTAFAFFANYLRKGEILWENDFIWCQDQDHNGDRIYTGRYLDPDKVNKNGFNIHRHLAIRPCYGLAPQIR